MDLFKSTDSEEAKLEDSYIRYFLSCNAYETYQEVTDIVERGRLEAREGFTMPRFLSVLKQMDISGYFYSRRERVDGVSCIFVKFVSPDLFLHMNNSRNFNITNKYSKGFESSILLSRLEKMVPFP